MSDIIIPAKQLEERAEELTRDKPKYKARFQQSRGIVYASGLADEPSVEETVTGEIGYDNNR